MSRKILSVAVMALCSLGLVLSAMAADDEFVGSAKCKACHKAEYESWEKTLHSKMVRKKDDGILKAVVEKWATDGTNPGPTKGNVTGTAFTLADVDLVVGSHWKQRFLVKNAVSGNHQFLDKQFNRMSGEWEPYGQKNDWEFMCATCHTTGYRLTSYDPANPKDAKAAFTEMNIGCESCHGPGAKHVKGNKKGSIWNPSKQSKMEQTRACGYCHIRGENELYKSPQGNYREDLPAPKVGDSFKPWDDWTKWYPEHLILPGIQPEDKIDAEYKGDLKGLFIVDEISKKNGVYEEAKHHQEYQGFIQSKHYKNNVLACNDCHSPHKGKNIKPKVAKDTCKTCHGDTYSYEKIMPGTAGTAKNLTVRTHTFFKDQSRPSKPTASGTAELNKK
ncbi:MAG: hypothetical protein HZA15_13895 [Nitrospirae bacterium]|nr:hypothetical protein [Nitrospirota bacterium]